MRAGTLEALRAQRVVPVIRSATPAEAIAMGRACAAAGMRVVELTRSTPGVEQAVAALAGEGLLVGVGTVTSVEAARRSVAAGAEFLVSFATDAAVLRAAAELDVPMIPGVLSPTEVLTAHDLGASVVKLFPAGRLTPEYLGDLRSVLPGVEVMATGGLSVGDGSAQGWLAAGALAVGLGSDLGSVAAGGPEAVRARAAAALAAVAPTGGEAA